MSASQSVGASSPHTQSAGHSQRGRRPPERPFWLARLRNVGVVVAAAAACALVAILAAPSSVSFAAPAAPATGIREGIQAQVSWTCLNLRTNPGLATGVVTCMPRGSLVSVNQGPMTADGLVWWQVTYQGTVGFAADEGLVPALPGLKPGIDATVTVPFLNLRSSPTLHCNIITQMPQGSLVHIVDGPFFADGHQWWQVTFQGTPGFSAGDVGLAPASSTPAPPTCSASCPTPRLTPGGDAVVNVPFLRLRSCPGLGCGILATMPEDATVEVISGPSLADGHEWWQVRYQGMTGFAAADAGLMPAGGPGQ